MDSVLALLLLSATGQPASVDTDGIKSAISVSIDGCEKWIIDPGTWAENIGGFPSKAGLDKALVKQDRIAEVLMPPLSLRRSNHHWYAAAGKDQGVFLTTSDTAPFCHIAGGGQSDFQPAVEALLADPAFLANWQKRDSDTREGMVSDRFVNKNNALEIIVSRAAKPEQRTDRVQFLATVRFAIRN